MNKCRAKTNWLSTIMSGLVILASSPYSYAELLSGDVLEIEPGNVGVFFDVNQAGSSYFTVFEGTPDIRVIGLQPGPDLGIVMNQIQTASGSHQSPPGSEPEFPGIDAPWGLFGATGMHLTTSPVTVVNGDVNNDGGFTKLLDFSGWSVIYSSWQQAIPLGGDAVNFPADTGMATISCTLADCPDGSPFVLDYNAHVGPFCNVFPFCEGVNYRIHLEGQIAVSNAPVINGAWVAGNNQFLFIFGENFGGVSEVMVNGIINTFVQAVDDRMLIVIVPNDTTQPVTVKVTTPSGMAVFPEACSI